MYLDPRIEALEALGVEELERLLDPERSPGPRAEALEPVGGRTRMRFPLPGTPLYEGGPITESPRGVGTGWVLLERWIRPALGPSLRARLTHPRSLSLAERSWNLLCHLRAGGVGTPEPLAVGSIKRGLLARDSFLITREFENYLSLPEYLAVARGAERQRGIKAVALTLAKIIRCGVYLPQLAPEKLMVSAPKAPGETLCDLKAELPPPGAGPGLKLNRMPSALLSDVEGGCMRTQAVPGEVAGMFLALRELPLSSREGLRALRLALGHAPRPLRKQVQALLRAAGVYRLASQAGTA